MATNKFLRFIRCWAGKQVYALDMTRISTIQRTDFLQQAAEESGQVGWLELAGQRVMVWSLAERLGETAVSLDDSQRIIVLNDPVQPWGLLVERVSQVETAVSGDIHLLPSIALNETKPYFDRIIRKDDDLLLLLSPDCLHPEHVNLPPASNGVQSLFTKSIPDAVKPRQNGTPHQVTVQQQGQIIIFKLPGQVADNDAHSFVLSIAQVPEVLEPLPIFPVPGALAALQGLVNWRNRPVPVINLAQRLGIPVNLNRNHRSRLMIVRTTGVDQLVGFMIDPAIQVVRLPLKYVMCKRPLPLNTDFISATLQADNEKLIVLDMAHLVTGLN